MDAFSSILQDIGRALEIEDLRPDRINSCLIRFKTGVQIQIELDPSQEFLIVGSELGPVPPGRYRENLLLEAMRANGAPHPLHGTLAFSKKKQVLVLFLKLPMKNLTGDKVAQEIQPFLDKALIWVRAVSKEEIPPTTASYHSSSSRSPGGIFGLRP